MHLTAEEARYIREHGKKLVDANKIKAVVPCCEPVDGDLVRISTFDGEFIAVVNHLQHDALDYSQYQYYTTQDGRMFPRTDVKVLGIIGKCVFSVYV